MAIELSVYTEYAQVEEVWRELELAWRGGELTLDLEAHRILWRGFYRDRGARLEIHVARRDGAVVAIIPLLHTPEDAEGSWTFCDDFLIGREYFCAPDVLPQILPHLPPHLADDLSCFYLPRPDTLFQKMPGAVVDLGSSESTYFGSLDKKARYQLRRTRERNRDVHVEADTVLRRAEIEGLTARYLDLWSGRARGDSDRVAYSRDKVSTDLELMARAEAMGKLVALYFRVEDVLVAANFSVLRERDRVDDYLCLRDPAPEYLDRGLGILAVLANMEVCRSRGVRWYDLSACVTDYKRRFLNTDLGFYAWAGGPRYRPAASAASTAVVGSP